MSGPRVGMFGHGWWSRKYLVPALAGAGADLVAVCGRDPGRAAEAAAGFGVARSFHRLEDMLDAVALDALVIASSPSSHLAAVTAAGAAGLAVFCEKPLARDAAETARMLRACAGANTVVGFTQRWNPAMRTVKRLLAEGAVGRVRHVRYRTASSLSADPGTPWDWRYDPREYAHGVLSDLGPHAVDLIRWLVGDITEVSATGHTVHGSRTAANGTEAIVRNWDECAVTARLASGAHASLALSRVLPISPYRRFQNELDVVGSRGTLAFTSDRPVEVVLAPAGGEPRAVPVDELEPLADAGPFEQLMAVMRHGAARQGHDMVEVFRGGAPEHAPTLADGHTGQLVLDAAAASAAARAWTPCPEPAPVR
ncbi:Myo-inositol 2-dehydrogenase like [Actinokineospora spheciospongiae]|uniref:Myo-inositol 2-dehydrogenase like n=1 Tax=Actinokineospora spheciospongiae TaxID=909613 RepID=W7J307_9PSEU|nr:Gfo/Idh/MocA family oxidoreductase [Actinokineospora spheciospongiae]EWC63321.1 Myo-inositol 2-dehydrogenase like [Actinokineospora spheciospongiae]